MSQTEAAGQHFYGHLLSLHGSALLLPKQAMIEAVSMETIDESDGPEWFLGYSEWHGRRVPVVSLEAMSGGEVPLHGRRTRVAIINSVGSHLSDGLFAIMTTSYPHLLPLNPAALQPGKSESRTAELALAQVRLANRDVFVPDLEKIEQRIAEITQASNSKKTGGGAAASKSDDSKASKGAASDKVDDSPIEDWEPSIDLGLPD